MNTSPKMLPQRLLFIFLLELLFPIQSFAQSAVKLKPAPVASEADIQAIRQAFQKINSTNLSKQHFNYESSGCVEDGEVDFFLDNGKIVKITEAGAIGDGSWVTEFYYSEGKVIFCVETLVGGPAIGKETKTQYRYYIKDNRAIRVMEGTKIISNDSKAADALRIAARIYKAYTTKKFASALCDD